MLKGSVFLYLGHVHSDILCFVAQPANHIIYRRVLAEYLSNQTNILRTHMCTTIYIGVHDADSRGIYMFSDDMAIAISQSDNL
jgi:hypothetical protein